MIYGNSAMIKFEKASKFRYNLVNGDQLVDRAMELVRELSGDKTFIEAANTNLLQTILSRLVAVEFFKQVTIDDDVLTVLVDVTHNKVTYTTSLGILPDLQDSGTEKIVESFYIK